MNLVPSLQSVSASDFDVSEDFDPVKFIRKLDTKLVKVRKTLNELYHDQFLFNIFDQSIDKGSRYKKVTHDALEPNDIVLLKDEFKKPHQYDMAKVESVQVNDLGETTGAVLVKGNRERVKRHATSIVPLLKASEFNMSVPAGSTAAEEGGSQPEVPQACRPKRRAAIVSELQTKKILQH